MTAAATAVPHTLVLGRVSVVVPCYGVAALVHRTLDSLLAQTYPDTEIVVVDDCSQDDLMEALAPYLAQITLCRHAANQGVSAARNTGAAAASGSILAFLDGDDWWPPDFLAALAPQVADGTVVCYDNIVVSEQEADTAIVPTGPTLFEQAHWTRPFLEWDTMDAIFQDAPIFKILITQADFARTGGYDTRYHGIEDFHLCVKMLAHRLRLEMKLVPRGFYLIHSTSFIRTHNREEAKQRQALSEWLLMYQTMPRELDLTPAAAEQCRRGARYWTLRLADLRLRQAVRARQWGQMLRPDFLRATVPFLPALCAMKAQALLRKALPKSKP